MRRGKEIAQGSHASMAFLLHGMDIRHPKVVEWINGGQTKVCLQIHSEEELFDLYYKAIKAGLTANMITDAGRTEFNGVPTVTCMAIGPDKSEEINAITGHLKIY